ncbi:MAG: MarR family transcriptional regulator [Chloroflexota bacterium]|nr:MarR family transcriptional regulator [Chloroflexota bacterium]
MKTQTLASEHEIIEHALRRLMWMEQKRLTQLLSEHGLTLPQFIVLTTIHMRGKGCPIGTLADEMFQSYPTMTGIVDRLEDAKLVARERGNTEDRRKVVVTLTEAGRHILDRARSARRESMRRALAHFSATDRRDFLRLLRVYLDALEKESE